MTRCIKSSNHKYDTFLDNYISVIDKTFKYDKKWKVFSSCSIRYTFSIIISLTLVYWNNIPYYTRMNHVLYYPTNEYSNSSYNVL